MKHFILVIGIIAAAIINYRYQKNQHLFGNLQQKSKWELLFDGKDLSKWRQAYKDSVPPQAWVVEGNTLSVQKGKKGGDIITRETYQNFELVFDFKLTEAANSGIKYHVNFIENVQTKKSSMMGIEYQVIDDYNHPEIKDNPNSVSSTGAAYLLYPPVGKKLKPAGEWNNAKIIVKGNYAEHWLNGLRIVSYFKGTDEFNKKVSETKFKDYPDYAKSNSGYIMLTDHGDQVYFRNIKVRRL
ncbi:MAG: DUF1080 domain-containing protein [Chitinophagaceae bacterium]|nr:DUF1080 domain-containing protein [Chitinophagaceae bacterium]